ncbi:MAG: histidine--tRNA ligase [Candidatus Margulisbacteria bacterium]|nr:histidine--tRNA ligase [Candidatus Margulisiibacteriota bacterium]
MKYTRPRGTKDILPSEIGIWQHIESVSRSIFQLYNYEEIRTPIFESTELFAKNIGNATDIVEKEMYTFEDKGGRKITLRPEGTAPIVRSYIQNSLHKTEKVSKLYYMGPMFRYERPQAGRFRQFHQIGVENLGTSSPISDAEVIALGIQIFDELGLNKLSVSINSVGCPVCRPVIEERLKQFLSSNLDSLCTDCNRRFNQQPLRILDCKNKKCTTYFSGLPDISSSLCQECNDHFSAVQVYLDLLGIKFTINPTLVRGLEYYTRTTFEIVSDQLGAQNAVCGGGRYDHLVKNNGGPSTPAVGFAFGVERTIMVLKEIQEFVPISRNIDLYLIPLGQPQRNKCFIILQKLRKAGVICEMGYDNSSLKSHMKQANRLSSKHVLIYGEDEAEKKRAILKNMKTGKQKRIKTRQIIGALKHEFKV